MQNKANIDDRCGTMITSSHTAKKKKVHLHGFLHEGGLHKLVKLTSVLLKCISYELILQAL